MFKKIKSYDGFSLINEIAQAISVDKSALNKIRRCYTQIITNYGFFADLLFNLTMMEAHPKSGIETMATDGKSIAYSAKFVNSLTEAEVVFVIIHEIMHNANFHFNRQGNRQHQLWNRAADYAINIQINDMKADLKSNLLSPPKGILLDEKYRGMSAEQIYEILEQKQKSQPKQQKGPKGPKGPGEPGGPGGQGDPGDEDGEGDEGGGDGQSPEDGTMGGDIKEPGSLAGKGTQVYEGNSDLAGASKEELEEVWKQIRNDAAVKNAGSGSSSLDRWLRKVNKPKINWRVELKKFIAQVYDELDYAYFNKRYISQELMLPGPKDADVSSYQDVVIAIDTSGSITDDTLSKFGAEMLKLFKTYNIYKCHVIWCDSNIPKNGVQTFDIADKTFKLDKLKPQGGGGTSFKPPFKWVQDNLLKKGKTPAFVIYFTDAAGEAPTPLEYGLKSYSNRVLWVITETDAAPHLKFGKKLYIDKMP